MHISFKNYISGSCIGQTSATQIPVLVDTGNTRSRSVSASGYVIKSSSSSTTSTPQYVQAAHPLNSADTRMHLLVITVTCVTVLIVLAVGLVAVLAIVIRRLGSPSLVHSQLLVPPSPAAFNPTDSHKTCKHCSSNSYEKPGTIRTILLCWVEFFCSACSGFSLELTAEFAPLHSC